MVNDSPPPEPRPWVQNRDGRVVPLDPDRISRSLFATTESLGQPDAFLTRELTDGVLHFLAQDSDAALLTTAHLAEVVVQVVRELGQPLLAEAYAECRRHKDAAQPLAHRAGGEIMGRTDATPANSLAAHVRKYTLQTVYSRDLAAAHADGLLALTGLETPDHLNGLTLVPPVDDPSTTGILAALENAGRIAGQFVALDSPEYLLAHTGQAPGEFLRGLALGLQLTNLRVVVNLNAASPPAWAVEGAQGPLFAGHLAAADSGRAPALADEILETLAHTPALAERLRVDWHVGAADFLSAGRSRLDRVIQLVCAGRQIGFAFDRPRRPVVLAEGLDRDHPALLTVVGVNLPRLACHPRVRQDRDDFLEKLGSLARLALSAGLQKREYLRRLERSQLPAAPALSSGFVLERARLVVVPIGVDHVVQSLNGHGLCQGDDAPAFGTAILRRLGEALRAGGQASLLDTCLDGPMDFVLGETTLMETAGDPMTSIEHRLATADASGHVQVREWLESAWQSTGVCRLRVRKV